MALGLMAALTALMVATSFLSGIFGMAGGIILMGVLLALLPVPETMALHAITQLASNGWRGLLWWRYIRWHAAVWFIVGGAVSFAVWAMWQYVPSKPMSLIVLGATPFVARAIPGSFKPNPTHPLNGACYGAVSMSLMLVTGVTGPLIDTFFLGGGLERREIIATKAICQVVGHAAKLIYFGAAIAETATIDWRMAGLAVVASMVGTSLARPVLERLTDLQYRVWATRMITVLAGGYLAQGGYLLLVP